MRKLLALLLISLIACEAAENFVETNFLSLQDIADWFKKHNLYDVFLNKLHTQGKNSAIAFCTRFHINRSLCKILAENTDKVK